MVRGIDTYLTLPAKVEALMKYAYASPRGKPPCRLDGWLGRRPAGPAWLEATLTSSVNATQRPLKQLPIAAGGTETTLLPRAINPIQCTKFRPTPAGAGYSHVVKFDDDVFVNLASLQGGLLRQQQQPGAKGASAAAALPSGAGRTGSAQYNMTSVYMGCSQIDTFKDKLLRREPFRLE